MPQRPVQETRLANFRAIAREVGGISAMAARLRRSQAQWQNTIGKTPTKGIGDKLAREVEVTFGKAPGWADTPWDLLEQEKPAPGEPVADFSLALNALFSAMAEHRPVEARAVAAMLAPYTKPGTLLAGLVGVLPAPQQGNIGGKSRRA